PTPCVLKDYRLAFNRRSESKPTEEGLANIISENGQEVEGVLYQLPKTTLEFLKSHEPGYHTIKVKVQVRDKATGELNDKVTEAEVLMADANKVGENLKPNRADITSIIEGAAEHGLSKSYQDTLKGFDPAPESPVVTAPTGNGGGSS
ncbi:MAG TPA: gamma-glutamylcyclotransferase family protein, partial [Pyrinomonadaceae bacterium]|nr:gamma-glutamylcyclotransferase family protein [Pyrinomonadaceae bacterium]